MVGAHIISGTDRNDVNAVYHSRLLSDMAKELYDKNSAVPGIPAGDGVIKPKRFGDNCKQFYWFYGFGSLEAYWPIEVWQATKYICDI